MRYPYICLECDKNVEIVKSIAEIEKIEICEICKVPMNRMISEKISFQGEKVDDNKTHFNPALGVTVNSLSHARRIAKERGLIEIGNDTQNNLRPEMNEYSLTRREYDEVTSVGTVRGS